MKITFIEDPPNFFMTNQSRKESGQGKFGDILNMKMQSIQAKPVAETVDTADQDSSLIQLFASTLKLLEDLNGNSGFDLDESKQKLLQETIVLLDRIKVNPAETGNELEEALDHFILTINQLESEGSIDSEELEVVLNLLHAALQQNEPMKNDASSNAYKNIGYSVLATRQILVQPNNANRSEQGMNGQADGNVLDIETGIFGSHSNDAEAEEALAAAIRMQPKDSSKEMEGSKAVLLESADQKGTQASPQLKSSATIGQASNINTTSDTEEVIVRLAETGSNEKKARELIRQFTNVLQKSQFSQALQTKSLTIRLYPEHLGTLRIELMQRDGAMIARILASTSMAKDMLDSQIHQLRQAFVQQNIQVDKLDITYQEGLNKYSSQDQRGRDQEQPGSEQGAEKDSFTGENDEEDFSKFLQKVLFEMEV